jgi:signal transduction histidine kinase
MKKLFRTLLILPVFFVAVAAFAASEHGTAEDAKAMVKKAVAFYKANGKEKTFAALNDPKGAFVDRDIYVSVYDMHGVVLAYMQNAKLIGKDVSGLKDGDGKEFIKDILSQSKAKGAGSTSYKWPHPVTKELQGKTAYFEKVDDMVFSSGYYN